jgi:hypothetical protein
MTRRIPSAVGTLCEPAIAETPDDFVAVDLSREERQMLVCGLTDWGGSVDAMPTDLEAIGVGSHEELYEEAERISAGIASGEALPRRDWTRALVSTERVYIVEGHEWASIQGGTPEYWDGVLEGLRQKLR